MRRSLLIGVGVLALLVGLLIGLFNNWILSFFGVQNEVFRPMITVHDSGIPQGVQYDTQSFSDGGSKFPTTTFTDSAGNTYTLPDGWQFGGPNGILVYVANTPTPNDLVKVCKSASSPYSRPLLAQIRNSAWVVDSQELQTLHLSVLPINTSVTSGGSKVNLVGFGLVTYNNSVQAFVTGPAIRVDNILNYVKCS